MVFSVVTIQESSISLQLPHKSRDYTARVTAVDALGTPVEEFSLGHSFTLAEETVEQGNAENSTTGTGEVKKK